MRCVNQASSPMNPGDLFVVREDAPAPFEGYRGITGTLLWCFDEREGYNPPPWRVQLDREPVGGWGTMPDHFCCLSEDLLTIPDLVWWRRLPLEL